MEFESVIRGRRSIRAYTSQPVPEGLVREILDEARWAPSSRNTQAWNVWVVSAGTHSSASRPRSRPRSTARRPTPPTWPVRRPSDWPQACSARAVAADEDARGDDGSGRRSVRPGRLDGAHGRLLRRAPSCSSSGSRTVSPRRTPATTRPRWSRTCASPPTTRGSARASPPRWSAIRACCAQLLPGSDEQRMVVAVTLGYPDLDGSGQHLRALARRPRRDRDLGVVSLVKRITPEDAYRRRWQLLALTSVGAFMAPLDGSIVAVALPSMGKDLHLTFTAAIWVQAAYLLTTAVLLIPVGRLADEYGRVRFYLLGIAVFTLGSLLAALSMNGAWLIGSRIVQGAAERSDVRDRGGDRHRGLPAQRARPRPRHQRHGRVPRPEPGSSARRPPRRHARLAVDLPDQPAHRPGRVPVGPGPAAASPSGSRMRRASTTRARRCSASSSSVCSCRSRSPRSGAGRLPPPSACCCCRSRRSSSFVVVERRVKAPILDLDLLAPQPAVRGRQPRGAAQLHGAVRDQRAHRHPSWRSCRAGRRRPPASSSSASPCSWPFSAPSAAVSATASARACSPPAAWSPSPPAWCCWG